MGAKPGGTKGNEQKAEYEEPGRKTRETRSKRTGGAKEARAERAHRGSHCEAEPGRTRKGRSRGQVAGPHREADERKRIGRGQTESRNRSESGGESTR